MAAAFALAFRASRLQNKKEKVVKIETWGEVTCHGRFALFPPAPGSLRSRGLTHLPASLTGAVPEAGDGAEGVRDSALCSDAGVTLLVY